MLAVMWENSLKGKTWRILQDLSNDLTTSVKTKYGTTREIHMEIGGKQGSRLTGCMFNKLMDVLAEEIIQKGKGIEITTDLIIGALLWVDDVCSCVEGVANQTDILN